MPKDIHVPARIVGGKIPVRASLGQTVIVTEGPETYTGLVTVTPSETEQVLQTKDKLVTDNVTVNPIPSEYTDAKADYDNALTAFGVESELADGISALTEYSNEITGEADENLSDAVRTLVDGYGAYNIEDILSGAEPSGEVVYNTDVPPFILYGRQNITSARVNGVVTVGNNAFQNCIGLTKVVMSNVTRGLGQTVFSGCSNLVEIHAPHLSSAPTTTLANCGFSFLYLPSLQTTGSNTFSSCRNLETAIFPAMTAFGAGNVFANTIEMKTIVFGHSNAVVNCQNVNCFSGTPFAQGGEGGEIYIPKVLYDHLGDGTALDYKAHARWSVLDGYGTITWKQIEGSEYEAYMPGGAKYEEEMSIA